MLKEIFYAGLILCSIPAGFILAWLAKDELKAWRKRFYVISIICLIFSLILLFTNFSLKIPVVLSLVFIVVVFSILIMRAKK